MQDLEGIGEQHEMGRIELLPLCATPMLLLFSYAAIVLIGLVSYWSIAMSSAVMLLNALAPCGVAVLIAALFVGNT